MSSLLSSNAIGGLYGRGGNCAYMDPQNEKEQQSVHRMACVVEKDCKDRLKITPAFISGEIRHDLLENKKKSD